MDLQRELDTFRRELPAMLADPAKSGRFVLIHNEVVDSFWPSLDEALAAGYDRFGLDPFLVKRVIERETPMFLTRRVNPCR